MEDHNQQLPVYNSDSGGDEQVDIDGLSEDMNGGGGCPGESHQGWI
jgi:hypothetical protein